MPMARTRSSFNMASRARQARSGRQRAGGEDRDPDSRVQDVQGSGRRIFRLLLAIVLNPDLRGHEKIFPGHAALPDGLAHGRLVLVGRGRVDQAVADGDGVRQAALADVEIVDLVDAEAQNGHLDAVVEGHLLHVLSPAGGNCPAWHMAVVRVAVVRVADVQVVDVQWTLSMEGTRSMEDAEGT